MDKSWSAVRGRLTRQDFLLLSAGAGASLLLAGCGGGPENNPAVQGSGGGGKNYDGPRVELAFWNGFTGGDGPYMRQIVEEFVSEHDNIRVKMNTIEWDDFYSRTPSAVQSGQGPDVAVMHSDQLGTNAARNVIIPLDDVARELNLKESDFATVVWQAGIYNDQRFGIPLDMHPMIFYYNKGLMEEAGLDPESPPRNREDFVAALEEMKGRDIQGFWVSPFLFTGGLSWESLLFQFGGQLYNEDVTEAVFNSDAGVEALTFLVNMVRDGYSPRDVAQDAEFTAFQNGQNAFHFNGIWQINPLREVEDLDVGITSLPQIGSEEGAWAGSHNFVIMRQQQADENKLQASKVFINWISEHSLEWARAGQIPARASVRESEGFQELQPQATIAEQIPNFHFVPPEPGIGDVQPTTFEQAVNEAVLLRREPKEALDAAAERANQLLEENRQKYQA
ncbi:MAG TPA: ABC transporter substrate-binding protein [Rubrobacteraceae bacterium]|nr:ABC transporter substrate-binding protein [Rubrobacteraceae bacterium]